MPDFDWERAFDDAERRAAQRRVERQIEARERILEEARERMQGENIPRVAVPQALAQQAGLQPGDEVQIAGQRFRVMPNWMQGERWEEAEVAKMRGKGKRGEELFHLILSGLREVCEVEGVIAGGAVRDLYAGDVEGTKDVDVFIPMTVETLGKCSSELGWQKEPYVVKAEPYKAAAPGQGCMFETHGRMAARVQGILVDLVLTKEPLGPKDVATFPVHAQRCVWTLEGGKSCAPEATKDLMEKTFTIDPTITDKDRIKSVLAKARTWKTREIYKDWKIVEPDVKEWWEEKERMEVEHKKLMEEYEKAKNAPWFRIV